MPVETETGGENRNIIVHAQSGLWEIDRRCYVCVEKRVRLCLRQGRNNVLGIPTGPF